MPAAPLPSPCVGVCRLDPATGWCLGCGRTIEEIAGWATAGTEDRGRVMAALPARRQRLASR